MSTISDITGKLGSNLVALPSDLKSVVSATASASLQYNQLTASAQDAVVGSNKNGLQVIGTAATSFNEDGSVKNTAISTLSSKVDTFGSLTGDTGGFLLNKTVTAATAEAADAAFRDTFGDTLSKKEMFENSLTASEALSDVTDLEAGSSAEPLITQAAELLLNKSDNMLEKVNFKESILDDLMEVENLSENIEVSSQVSKFIGESSIPVIDYRKDIPPRTLLKTFEEMEAYIRTCSREITEVVVHATDTTRDMEVNYDVLYRWDVVERNFTDVGYHLIILRDGSLQVCRPISKVGAHTLNGHNKYSIGIAFVGGLLGNRKQNMFKRSHKSYTQEQFNTFNAFMKAFYTVVPGGQAWGHNDIDQTRRSDPHFDVPKYVRKKFNKYNVQTLEATRRDGALTIDELIGAQY